MYKSQICDDWCHGAVPIVPMTFLQMSFVVSRSCDLFCSGLFFRGEGRADQKMPFNFCSHLLADGLKQEKDETSWYDTDTGFLDSRLWTWHFRKCKIRRDNTINLQPHMETECWLLVMRGHHAMLALDPLIWMSIIFVPTADQSSSAVFLFWCWQCQKGSVSCNI